MPGLDPTRRRRIARLGVQLFVDRGMAARPGWAASGRRRVGDRSDLPAPRRHPARSRAGRRASAQHGAARDRRSPRSLGRACSPCRRSTVLPRQRTLGGDRRVVVPPAVRTGAGDVPAGVGVRRRLRSRCCVSSVRRAGHRRCPTSIDLVDSLVDKSLVLAAPDVDGTRYRVLEPLRQWAQDAARPTRRGRRAFGSPTPSTSHDSSSTSCRRPTTGRGQEVALRRTAVDYPNIRLALATLAEAAPGRRAAWRCASGCSRSGPTRPCTPRGCETCLRSLEPRRRDLRARVKAAFVGAVCGAWTRPHRCGRHGGVGLRLAERARRPALDRLGRTRPGRRAAATTGFHEAPVSACRTR